MTDQQQRSTTQGAPGGTFSWHPTYAGQTFDLVQRGLASDIARDQRQYHLALEGAEQSEHESLSSVVELERRWGNYAFDWAEMDANELAARIVSFERDRERRQELISFADFRAQGGLVGGDGQAGHREPGPFPVRTVAIAVVAIIVIILFFMIATG